MGDERKGLMRFLLSGIAVPVAVSSCPYDLLIPVVMKRAPPGALA